MDDLFNQLISLVEQLQTNFKERETNSIREYEIESDSLYKEYWSLVYDNFNDSLIREVVNEIGYGNFITFDFVTSLKQAWEKEYHYDG